MPLIPLIASAIIGALSSVLASLLQKAILALGISAISYVGLDALVGKFDAYFNARIGTLSADTYAFISAAGGITAIKMFLASVTASFAIMSAQRFVRIMAK